MRHPNSELWLENLAAISATELIWCLEDALVDYANYRGFHTQQDASRRIQLCKQELLRRLALVPA